MANNTPEDPEAPEEETFTLTFTRSQMNFVLNGLHNELLDARRYASGTSVKAEPGPMDLCCAGHREEFEHRQKVAVALAQRKVDVQEIITMCSEAIGEA